MGDEWQSMESAPRDGTRVLLVEDGVIVVGWYNGRGWVHDGYDYDIVVCPDHWQPLPPLPKRNP